MDALARPRARYIKDILIEHQEELEFLWTQRGRALHSAETGLREFSELGERIEAHVQGLLLAGMDLVDLLKGGLAEPLRSTSFSCAYPLLRLRHPEAVAVVQRSFVDAQAGTLAGLRDALGFSPIDRSVIDWLQHQLDSGDAAHAVSAATILCQHGALGPEHPRLAKLLTDADPLVQVQAWPIVARLDAPGSTIARPYETAIREADPPVRAAALEAACWTRQEWLLPLCRQLSLSKSVDYVAAMQLYAELAPASAAPEFLYLSSEAKLGTWRAQLLGSFGHPEGVPVLLCLMEEDPATANAAAQAFRRITGEDVESDRRVALPVAEDSDDFAKEFAPEVSAPDIEKAKMLWARGESVLRQGTRWSRGFDLSQGVNADVLRALDLSARWAACRRAAYAGNRIAPPPPLC